MRTEPLAPTDVYDKFAARVRDLVRYRLSRSLAPRLDPDDLVQSVFRRFFVGYQSGRYSLPTDDQLWDLLVTITLNKLRSAERFHRAACRDVQKTTGGDALGGVVEAGPADLEQVIADVLDELPDDARDLVRLRLEGWEVAEIANRIGKSKRTVERLLQELREQLRDALTTET